MTNKKVNKYLFGETRVDGPNLKLEDNFRNKTTLGK
jgi:hypothetical protein